MYYLNIQPCIVDEGGGGRRRGRLRRGRRNAAESHAEESTQHFEHIKDDLKNPEIRQQFNDDHLFKVNIESCLTNEFFYHPVAEKFPGNVTTSIIAVI